MWHIRTLFTVEIEKLFCFVVCFFQEWKSRGKKITCPGARDKLNFRQDKHIFSPNVLWTSKKFTDSLFVLGKDKLFGNRTSKNFDVLAQGTSENFLDFFTPEENMTTNMTAVSVGSRQPPENRIGLRQRPRC